jgi:hypothetical protein
MTYGEQAVGLSFNPSGDEDVKMIKKLYATIIDFCHSARRGEGSCDEVSPEKARLFSIAITEAQGAQMWAVKAITWRLEDD